MRSSSAESFAEFGEEMPARLMVILWRLEGSELFVQRKQ